MAVAVVVDDIQGTVYGHRGEVERDASLAADFLVEELEVRGLPVSKPKLQLTGNSWTLVKAIASRCKPLRRAAARSVRNLGADYAAGRQVVHRTRAKRLQKVLSRARRFRALGRSGRRGLKIARVALGPAALFAVSVTGLLDKHRQLLRRALRWFVNRPAGLARSTWPSWMPGPTPRSPLWLSRSSCLPGKPHGARHRQSCLAIA